MAKEVRLPTLGFIGFVLMACLARFSEVVLNEVAVATIKLFDNLRAVGYVEVFMISGSPITKNLKTTVSNTADLDNQADPTRACPACLWAKVDPEVQKKERGILGVFKNGPRDWIELCVSKEIRTFDSLEARWFMTVNLPKNIDLKKNADACHRHS